MRKSWLPVRCCCTPDKILGFLRVPTEDFDKRDHVYMLDRYGSSRMVKFGVMKEVVMRDDVRLHGPAALPRSTETAVYSDDHPLEFWKTFREFIPVDHTLKGE